MRRRPRRLEGHQRARAIPPRYGSPLSPSRCFRPSSRRALEHATSGRSRHAPHRAVNDLDVIYRRLAIARTQHELSDDYRAALQQGGISAAGSASGLARPIALLASAIPPSARSTRRSTRSTRCRRTSRASYPDISSRSRSGTSSTHLASVIGRSNSMAPTTATKPRCGSRRCATSPARYFSQRAWMSTHPPSSR
jgi:hypothetical protein